MARIAFYKALGNSPLEIAINWFIKLWTNGPYSHVELIDDGNSECPKEWDWYSASAFGEGIVRKKTVIIKDGHWDIFELPPLYTYHSIRFIKGELGKKYDWKGLILTQLFHLDKHNKNKWFCSELVRRALCEGALIPCDGKDHHSNPNKLYRELDTLGHLTLPKTLQVT